MKNRVLMSLGSMLVGAGGVFLLLFGPLDGVNADSKGTPCCNGDVNGNGSVDIADPVYLLHHLFVDGPGPVPMAPCGPGLTRLPATGPKSCYDALGADIDCADHDFSGQDGS